MSYRAKGWCLVVGVIAAVDLLAPPNQTLTDGARTALQHPVWKYVLPVVIYHVADHLTDSLDPRYDVLHQVSRLIGGMLSRNTIDV